MRENEEQKRQMAFACNTKKKNAELKYRERNEEKTPSGCPEQGTKKASIRCLDKGQERTAKPCPNRIWTQGGRKGVGSAG